MKITRKPEKIETYCYQLKDTEKSTEIILQPSIHLFEKNDQFMCQASLVFELPLERCVVSGKILQDSCLENESDLELQQLRNQELLSSETDQIIQPLFTIIQRLTYEVTEITFDQPGIDLNFVATVAE